MDYFLTRITASHEIMLGKPVVRGTRLTVELLPRKMSEGATVAELLAMYPQLEAADMEAVAADFLTERLTPWPPLRKGEGEPDDQS